MNQAMAYDLLLATGRFVSGGRASKLIDKFSFWWLAF